MYAAIVRRQIRSTFDQINQGNYRPMLDVLADDFEYHFHGDHALGGRRTTHASMILWWERVLRLLPDARFDIQDVVVGGGPWRTRVAVRSIVTGALPGGARYDNTVFSFLTLTWGRVTSIETIEDLHVLEDALRQVAASGRTEAMAAPIVD